MSKPEDIPQDVWDKAGNIKPLPDFKFAEWEQILQSDIARAIMVAKEEEREACSDAIRRANNTVGSISTPLMRGDNLAIVLCGQFDDGGPNEGDTGWSRAATAGYLQAVSAIREHYAAAIRKRGDG